MHIAGKMLLKIILITKTIYFLCIDKPIINNINKINTINLNVTNKSPTKRISFATLLSDVFTDFLKSIALNTTIEKKRIPESRFFFIYIYYE